MLLINIPAEDLKNPFDNLHRKLSMSVSISIPERDYVIN